MKQLTNRQLLDLQEKWVFYCNHYIKDLYNAGLNPSDDLKDAAEENELVLRLITNAITEKVKKKNQKRGKK